MIGIWLVDSRVSIFSSLPGLPPPPPPLPLLSMFAHLDSMVLLCFKRRFWDFFLLQRSVSAEERNFFSLSLLVVSLLEFTLTSSFFLCFVDIFRVFFMYISVPLFVPRRVECVLLLLLLVSLSLSFLARLFCSHPSTMGRLYERERITTRKPYHVNG